MNVYRALLTAGILSLLITGASAQQIESPAAPAGEAPAKPFLAPGTVDFRLLLADPPVPGSRQDDEDVAEVKELQTLNPQRFASAQLDADFVYPRFSDALGLPLTRAKLPLTIALLNRSLADVKDPTWAGKAFFHRPRPFSACS